MAIYKHMCIPSYTKGQKMKIKHKDGTLINIRTPELFMYAIRAQVKEGTGVITIPFTCDEVAKDLFQQLTKEN